MHDLQPLKHWIHPSNKVILLGDSCHPMLPYLAQGAAQATEDAGTLRAVLSPTTSPYTDLKTALIHYEKQRLPRAACITANTRVHQEWLHVYDGKVRDERDKLMQVDRMENPVFWAFEERKNWLFGYDAEVLLGEDELAIPEIPPGPPSAASVYKGLNGMNGSNGVNEMNSLSGLNGVSGANGMNGVNGKVKNGY